MPNIRDLLDLSTAHLPPHVCDRLSAQPGVIAYHTIHGWLLQVPDDPDQASTTNCEPVPDVVLAIQRYARALGCDYVLLDGEADKVDHLPTWTR
ncbi:DUF5983 family protein [Virgisporangium aurantiacum]|uniref:DUF5983 domain-containing protein n=1 Tax=Virgisporangium aurantiacum TaxID=175570 RepID=A0A8J3ZHS4_9ACTN|nr:hypothetical protein [Virgisporangium aurantiacum]GIJ64367.1 hypothetical protein Vau01_118830 [Virgisporangium aurantiacum]